jgi:hypothetical protein
VLVVGLGLRKAKAPAHPATAQESRKSSEPCGLIRDIPYADRYAVRAARWAAGPTTLLAPQPEPQGGWQRLIGLGCLGEETVRSSWLKAAHYVTKVASRVAAFTA